MTNAFRISRPKSVKKANTSCFFVEPEIWNLLHRIEAIVQKHDVIILPEIHEHHSIQMKIANQNFWIYDFALPVLVLNALYVGKGTYLKKWLEMSPKHQFTTLDTHDGIGIVDVKDLMPCISSTDISFAIFCNSSTSFSTCGFASTIYDTAFALTI